MRHSGEDDRLGGRMLLKSHHGAVYQIVSDMHKADRDGLSTLYHWRSLTIHIKSIRYSSELVTGSE